MKLQNKVAIVTGASGTVGRDISKKLVSEGCKVVLVGKNSKKLKKLVQDLGNKDNLLPLPSDITKEGDVLNIVEQTTNIFNTVDILVNNAGIINDPEPFHVTNEDEWRKLIEVNLVGTLHMTKSVLPIMMENKYGNIVNISSTLGTKAIPGVPLSIYGLTKGGLISFTKHISVEYGKYGIRCNCIVPSSIRSPYLEPYMNDENARKTLESAFPLGRIGDPIDVSNAVLYLCSDDSKWVTGTELDVDGGMSAK
ncbi:MAG: SDR family oxidoreductase [Nitrososphaeraceae archaeon]|nr:SDR family oxidoreductase [Nitrososphaeraceae archaeon]